VSHFAAPATENYLPTTACFFVYAHAEPGVLPRVLELFAKRGLVPSLWQSTTSGSDRSQLTIDIRMRGLATETVNYIAACLRQIAFVEAVTISEKRASA